MGGRTGMHAQRGQHNARQESAEHDEFLPATHETTPPANALAARAFPFDFHPPAPLDSALGSGWIVECSKSEAADCEPPPHTSKARAVHTTRGKAEKNADAIAPLFRIKSYPDVAPMAHICGVIAPSTVRELCAHCTYPDAGVREATYAPGSAWGFVFVEYPDRALARTQDCESRFARNGIRDEGTFREASAYALGHDGLAPALAIGVPAIDDPPSRASVELPLLAPGGFARAAFASATSAASFAASFALLRLAWGTCVARGFAVFRRAKLDGGSVALHHHLETRGQAASLAPRQGLPRAGASALRPSARLSNDRQSRHLDAAFDAPGQAVRAVGGVGGNGGPGRRGPPAHSQFTKPPPSAPALAAGNREEEHRQGNESGCSTDSHNALRVSSR